MNHVNYMREIGARGGARRKSNPDRFILAREAGRLSWMPEARAKRLSNKKRARTTKIVSNNENKV